ncbi:hypothetical protein FRC12_011297 [Ceratobasidium sp. 428]|nr:hypothetical protein FRC12_011297 [Ceratobasidium sp. 428]
MYINQVYVPNAVVASVVTFDVTFGSVGDLCLDYKYGCSLDHVAWVSYEGCFDVDRDGSADRLDRRSSHPTIQEAITWRPYPTHAFFRLCSLIIAYSPYPATKGIPREGMDLLFGEGDASLISSITIDYQQNLSS